MNSDADPYEVLGLNRDASDAQIKAAYRRLVQQTHPDVGGTDALFRVVTNAYETLIADGRWSSNNGANTTPPPPPDDGLWDSRPPPPDDSYWDPRPPPPFENRSATDAGYVTSALRPTASDYARAVAKGVLIWAITGGGSRRRRRRS